MLSYASVVTTCSPQISKVLISENVHNYRMPSVYVYSLKCMKERKSLTFTYSLKKNNSKYHENNTVNANLIVLLSFLVLSYKLNVEVLRNIIF